MNRLALNNKNWKILTPDGFVPFGGVSPMGQKELYRVLFKDNTFIDVSSEHRFFTEDGREIATRELNPGIILLGQYKNLEVVSITHAAKEETYDVIEVVGHQYFANGVLSHNCQFLSSDALLCDSMTTAILEKGKIEPIFSRNDFNFFQPLYRGQTYLVALDPATGTGKDFSVLEVFHFPSLKQVAEFRSNDMDSGEVYGKLKWLLMTLEKMQAPVYFTIENNGVGEGVIALYDNDPTQPTAAEFVSEDGRARLGMTTASKVKLRACLDFKQLFEKKKITVYSDLLFKEIKTFVRKRGSYMAQYGSTDDCISAMLLIVRMLAEMALYEQTAFDNLYSLGSKEYEEYSEDPDTEDYNSNEDPDPIIF